MVIGGDKGLFQGSGFACQLLTTTVSGKPLAATSLGFGNAGGIGDGDLILLFFPLGLAQG
jgi:hypothetical protein